MVPSRDNSKLYAVGRLPQAAIMAYDPREKHWTPYLGGLSASEIAVSPDKKWIAYISFPQATLWRERVDGSDRLELADQFAVSYTHLFDREFATDHLQPFPHAE